MPRIGSTDTIQPPEEENLLSDLFNEQGLKPVEQKFRAVREDRRDFRKQALGENYNNAVAAGNKARANKLKPQDAVIISLALEGFKQVQIAEKLGLRKQYVCQRLNMQCVKDEIKRRVDALDDRFLLLKAKAIDAFADALDADTDIDTRLAAADKWFKAHGYHDRSKKQGENNSLEDIVQQLLVQVNVNVNANIPDDPRVILDDPRVILDLKKDDEDVA